MGAVTFDSRWLKIWRGTRQLLGENSKSVQKNEILSYQILICKSFALEMTDEGVWLMKCLQWGIVWSWIYWVFKLLRVKCVYEFDFFPLCRHYFW